MIDLLMEEKGEGKFNFWAECNSQKFGLSCIMFPEFQIFVCLYFVPCASMFTSLLKKLFTLLHVSNFVLMIFHSKICN